MGSQKKCRQKSTHFGRYAYKKQSVPSVSAVMIVIYVVVFHITLIFDWFTLAEINRVLKRYALLGVVMFELDVLRHIVGRSLLHNAEEQQPRACQSSEVGESSANYMKHSCV